MKGRERLPEKEGENKERIERGIYTRKGGSLTVIVCVGKPSLRQFREEAGRRDVRKWAWGDVTESPQRGWRRLKSPRRRRGGMKLPDQGDQIIVGDRATRSEVHRTHGVRLTKEKENGHCM